MRKILVTIFILTFNISSVNAEEAKCDTVREKANPACSKILKGAGNKVGGVFGKLKEFSSKHQTIGQTLNGGVIKEKKERKKKRTLREFSEDNQKIDVKGLLKKF